MLFSKHSHLENEHKDPVSEYDYSPNWMKHMKLHKQSKSFLENLHKKITDKCEWTSRFIMVYRCSAKWIKMESSLHLKDNFYSNFKSESIMLILLKIYIETLITQRL